MRETSPMRKPPTGEPYAGKPHVRFGGRGGESLPDPYQGILSVALASSAAPPRTYGGGRGPLPKVSQQSDAAKQDKLLLTHPTRTGSGYARMQPVASARPGDDDLRASGDRASSGLHAGALRLGAAADRDRGAGGPRSWCGPWSGPACGNLRRLCEPGLYHGGGDTSDRAGAGPQRPAGSPSCPPAARGAERGQPGDTSLRHGAVLSVFMNNIGALALMLPVVASVSRLALLDQRRVLMPVSFATLLGGLCSLIGTPANLLVSQQLVAQRGAGFAFFDFALVGVPVALAGLLVLRVWNPLARPGETGRPSPLPGNSVRRVVTEVLVPSGSIFAGMEPSQLPARLHTLERAGKRVMFQRPGERLEAGDLLLLETDLSTLEAWLAGGTLSLAGARPLKGDQGWVEAVIMPQSTLIGSRLRTLESFAARGIRIVAVASQSTRIEGSLSDLQLGIGDVLFLEGEEEAISEALEEAGVLPL